MITVVKHIKIETKILNKQLPELIKTKMCWSWTEKQLWCIKCLYASEYKDGNESEDGCVVWSVSAIFKTQIWDEKLMLITQKMMRARMTSKIQLRYFFSKKKDTCRPVWFHLSAWSSCCVECRRIKLKNTGVGSKMIENRCKHLQKFVESVQKLTKR